MFAQRNFARFGIAVLLLVLACMLILPNGEARAATPRSITPSKVTPNKKSTPKILPITDAEQLAILTQKFGAQAKDFKIKHYSDSWIDNSVRWTTNRTDYGINWSGYTADVLPTAYYANHVYGNFTVPPVNTNRSPSISEWVGIGGVHGNTELIQAGASTGLYGGHPAIVAFFELFPAAPVDLWTLLPGENITVGIDATNTANGQWNIIVHDSGGLSEVIPVTGFYADRNTAEWIQERSTDSLNPSPIPTNAAPVYFTAASWGDQNSGTSRSIQDGEVGIVVREILRNAPPRGNNECLVPYNLSSAYGASSFNTVRQTSC